MAKLGPKANKSEMACLQAEGRADNLAGNLAMVSLAAARKPVISL